jgi:methylthioribulose-1-phosphate dehydratase
MAIGGGSNQAGRGVPIAAAEIVIAAGARLDRFGWVPATAGNISVRLDLDRLAITCSGVHKGALHPPDVIAVGLNGAPEDPQTRPSAETLLHCQLYRIFPAANAVVHGHSVAATVVSMLRPAGPMMFEGYEVQKAFEGQTTHAAQLILPLVDNDQDIARLARVLEPLLVRGIAGTLIRGHGTYTWGTTMTEALARFEALEFLLACTLERTRIA